MVPEHDCRAARPGQGKERWETGLSIGPIRKPKRVSEMVIDQEIRFPTGLDGIDRVLGGGAVQGLFVLIGGAPGIGKIHADAPDLPSALSVCQSSLCLRRGIRAPAEARAERLGVGEMGLYLFAENDLEQVSAAVEETAPDILIVDSIQTMYTGDQSTSPGSISQVKECTMALMQLAARAWNHPFFVIGHVNKEGNLAGPKVLEHMVDCVLYFEGDRHMSYRILRAAKTVMAPPMIGVFEMDDTGLREVPNPSQMLLEGRANRRARHLCHLALWRVPALYWQRYRPC